MPEFTYTARDIGGHKVRGSIQGADAAGARSALRHKGIFVTTLTEKQQASGLAQAWERRRDVKLTDLVVFSQQLSTMVGAGVNLAEAFSLLQDQTDNQRLKQVLTEITRDVQGGSALSSAMARHPRVFPELFISLVMAGEVGGVLEDTLLTAAANLERELELREKVKSAFMYPTIVLGVAVLVIGVMLVVVVPVFSKVYKQFHAQLPGVTMLLIQFSHYTLRYWWLMLLVAVAAITAFRRYAATPGGKRSLDRVKLRLPMLGKLNGKIVVTRFMESLGGLVAAGVPLLQGLEISSRVAGNSEFETAIKSVTEGVRQGQKLSDRLKATGKFPPMVSRMIEVGEETGSLESMMRRLTAFYQRDIEYSVRRLLTLLEPALTVVLGLIIGFVVLALYLPIFNLATVIKK